jgi:hypothetical protein
MGIIQQDSQWRLGNVLQRPVLGPEARGERSVNLLCTSAFSQERAVYHHVQHTVLAIWEKQMSG